jgi:hypothetical protein
MCVKGGGSWVVCGVVGERECQVSQGGFATTNQQSRQSPVTSRGPLLFFFSFLFLFGSATTSFSDGKNSTPPSLSLKKKNTSFSFYYIFFFFFFWGK